MRASDQNSPNAALIALRDKYRARAIRTWTRFEKAAAILKGRALRSKMLGFQSRRDYNIYAAESVGAITGLGDPAPDESIRSREVDLPDGSPDAIKIDSGLQPAAVATEEK